GGCPPQTFAGALAGGGGRACPPAAGERRNPCWVVFSAGGGGGPTPLPPPLGGPRKKESRLFLATQVVDEARHSYFFARVYNDVLGVGSGLRDALAHVGEARRSEGGYGRIFDPDDGELVTLTDAVRVDPRNYGKWVQALTVYHLMVEALLALPNQRRILRVLRASDLL